MTVAQDSCGGGGGFYKGGCCGGFVACRRRLLLLILIRLIWQDEVGLAAVDPPLDISPYEPDIHSGRRA